MPDHSSKNQICLIVGASHAGVNCAFQLRREGWVGEIVLFDSAEQLPYHRPPLSKSCLVDEDALQLKMLKPASSYEKDQISLKLGMKVDKIDKENKTISCENGEVFSYDKLVLATGAQAMVPPIKGLGEAKNLFTLRTASDTSDIRRKLHGTDSQRIVIIGGGFIGLEVAASFRKMGLEVVLLEREARILSRVSCPEVSTFFQEYHETKGVKIYCSKEVSQIEKKENLNVIHCSDGSQYEADLIMLGTGIKVRTDLAHTAGLEIENGIKVNEQMETSVSGIFAIGDNSYYFHPHYNRFVRLESVPNAVAQARIAAAAICDNQLRYEEIPWFWSDQFDLKFQTAGLFNGYEECIVRREQNNRPNLSVWYFKENKLMAVDAINAPKAYMLARKYIKEEKVLDKIKLQDPHIPISSLEMLASV